MDTIRQLISFFLKVAFGFFLAGLVWWLLSFLIPSFSLRALVFRNGLETSAVSEFLPSPRTFKGLFGRQGIVPTAHTNEYIPKAPFSGYGTSTSLGSGYKYSTYSYVTYSDGEEHKELGQTAYEIATTTVVLSNAPKDSVSETSELMERGLYLRNLSLYRGGHIYTGLSFVGEARGTMFVDGKFPIVVVGETGTVVGVVPALATTDWSSPGWVRFEAKIPFVIPNKTPCTLVFEQALMKSELQNRTPVRVPFSVLCN